MTRPKRAERFYTCFGYDMPTEGPDLTIEARWFDEVEAEYLLRGASRCRDNAARYRRERDEARADLADAHDRLYLAGIEDGCAYVDTKCERDAALRDLDAVRARADAAEELCVALATTAKRLNSGVHKLWQLHLSYDVQNALLSPSESLERLLGEHAAEVEAMRERQGR